MIVIDILLIAFILYLLFCGTTQTLTIIYFFHQRKVNLPNVITQKPIDIVIPAFEETRYQTEFIRYWEKMSERFLLNVIIVCSQKEASRETFLSLQAKLKHSNRRSTFKLIELLNANGFKIDQVVYAVKKLPIESHFLLLDFDSRPEPKLFEHLFCVRHHMTDRQIIQFPADYTQNDTALSRINHYESMRQTAWSIGVEYLLNLDLLRFFRRIYNPYLVGHGLWISPKTILRMYRQTGSIPVEDFALGYLANKMNLTVKTAPFFDRCDFVPSARQYVSQSQIWFIYSIKHMRHIKNHWLGSISRTCFWAFRPILAIGLLVYAAWMTDWLSALVLLFAIATYQILPVLILSQKMKKQSIPYLYAIPALMLRSLGPLIGLLRLLINHHTYTKTKR